MQTRQIDFLNIGLIVLTLLLSFRLPFHVFLFSYAVLGPLHYMTEINWLGERKYFSKVDSTPWIMAGFTLLISLGSFYYESGRHQPFQYLHDAVSQSFAAVFFEFILHWNLHLMYLAFVIAVAFAGFAKNWQRVLVIVLGACIGYFGAKAQPMTLILFSMLPTFFHVCVFTGLFMLYGALKARSIPGYWAFAVFVLAYVGIAFFPVFPSQYVIGPEMQSRFLDSTFDATIYQFGLLTGTLSPGQRLNLGTEWGVRMVILLSFAYTYHYLNWFSKTSVIKWHEVSRRKTAWALGIWLASMALYLYNYRLGLMALLFLSILHVFLEFPLNYISIAGIFTEIKSRILSLFGKKATA